MVIGGRDTLGGGWLAGVGTADWGCGILVVGAT